MGLPFTEVAGSETLSETYLSDEERRITEPSFLSFLSKCWIARVSANVVLQLWSGSPTAFVL